jgi:NADH:ubiquinone oxidoreductase subunit 5 (subunit L)/multisubunit Na+/H+ antiporter MnhA subunit
MQLILIAFFIIPLLAFLFSLFFKNFQEKNISAIAICASGLHIFLTVGFFINWLIQGHQPVAFAILKIFQSEEFNFGIDLYYDKLTAVYSIVTSILIFIVAIFSKTYMHRESGFKRFYNHFLLFYIGINLLIIAGNFETFFFGWEIVGITSFLLISFYRDRYLPVRNSMKVLSFYRLGDVALIGAVWFCHHLFHTNIQFIHLGDTPLLYDATHHHPIQGILISLLLIQAAAVKSAQLPFSSWLPRAMEGPTVSSAIFYGSLSVHIGVFLLIRTYPIWGNLLVAKIVIIAIGALTAIIASFIGSVQPTAKTQIAYSSITQIGLMFVEIGMGWHVLALVHFAANAFLRTYQLLVSPSIMSYLIHEQFFKYDPNKKQMFSFLPKKMYNTLYMLSIKEFNLDFVWYNYIWTPFKKVGKALHFLRSKIAEALFVIAMLFGVIVYIIFPLEGIHQYKTVSWLYAIIALILILIAWTERRTAIRSWVYVATSQVFFMLSVVQQHSFSLIEIALYLSGTLGAFVVGWWCLYKVKSIENNLDLNEFHGHIYEHPKYGLLFLLSALTMVGFPISPTFIGLDILFSEIEMHHRLLLILSSLTFVVLELAVLRIYARIFLGQHNKTYHEVAFRSS